MSQRHSGHSYRADSGRVVRTDAAAHGTRRTDYTLGHAGHQFRIGPVSFWIVVGTLVVMAGWSLATGTYFAFHDDVLSRLIARQKDQQFAYEDRIAELRAQVDRVTSRQLLNQEQFEQKLEHVMRRQSTLEQRASTLSGLPDPTPTGSINRRPTPVAEPPVATGEVPKPSPINDTVIFTAPARPRGAARIARAAATPRGALPRQARRARHRRRDRAPADFARPRRGPAGRGVEHA